MTPLLIPFRNWLSSHGIPFLRWRVASLLVGAVIALLGVGLSFGGLNYGIDFEGGILVEISLPEGKTADVLDSLKEAYPNRDIAIQPLSGNTSTQVYLVKLEVGEGEDSNGLLTSLRAHIGSFVGEIRRSELVGPAISSQLQQQAVFAFFWALLGILGYIWWRFQWRFAVVAIVALLHDMLAIIGFYGLTGYEINVSTVAVILTVAGYSINDTVVILDRIRENMGRFKTTPLPQVFERSINETLGRTLMTSLSTWVALIAIVLLGSGVVQEFAASLIWGVVVGTFSSIGLAVPLLTFLKVNRRLDPSSP